MIQLKMCYSGSSHQENCSRKPLIQRVTKRDDYRTDREHGWLGATG